VIWVSRLLGNAYQILFPRIYGIEHFLQAADVVFGQKFFAKGVHPQILVQVWSTKLRQIGQQVHVLGQQVDMASIQNINFRFSLLRDLKRMEVQLGFFCYNFLN
jgi:hypothetical protein